MKIDESNPSYFDPIIQNTYALYRCCRNYFYDQTKLPVEIYEGQTPILLIHGYLHNSSAWIPLIERLKKEHLGPIYSINLGSPLQSIEQYSQSVKALAQHIATETGRTDLILIGHSMGGVVSTYYALNVANKGTVKKVITLGTPLKGTYFGTVGVGEGARQMHWRSNFVTKLLQQIEEETFTKFVLMASKRDRIVVPYESASPFGDRLEHVKSLEFSDIGHLSYLYSDKVHDYVIKSIREN